jgi:hypothetical protein
LGGENITMLDSVPEEHYLSIFNRLHQNGGRVGWLRDLKRAAALSIEKQGFPSTKR